MKKISAIVLVCLFLPLKVVSGEDSNPLIGGRLQKAIEDFLVENSGVPGVMVSIQSEKLGIYWSGAAGFADIEAQVPIKARQPLRLASTTKTYIAAAILRLVELNQIELDSGISQYLPVSQVQLFENDGYNLGAITVRHVLTHVSGLWDFAQGNSSFAEMVRADPSHKWSRIEQLQHAVTHGEPLGRPGEALHYSDTGYILLGEIIEQRSGQGLAQALRTLLKFDQLGMYSTWLENLESKPKTVLPRVHQYYGKLDITDFDPSFDLYGGGGLVANMEDLSTFFAALFNGRIYSNSETLTTMLTSVIPDKGGPMSVTIYGREHQYCLGIYASQYKGYTVFEHGGFWGTVGGYVPAFDLSFGVAVNQNIPKGTHRDLFEKLLSIIIEETAA